MRVRLGAFALLSFLGLAALVTPTSIDVARAQSPAVTLDPGVKAEYAAYPRGKSRRRAAYRQAGQTGGKYFVEFRSRYALSYGHTYAAFGRLNAAGQIISSEVAGLHPAGESSAPWMLGHLIPVPSETGPSDGDLEEKYVSARYRVTMDEAEYSKVVGKIRQMQASTPLWSATLYNCNSFVGDIARFMGLSASTSTLQVPEAYITSLRRINNGQSSIAPGSI